MKSDAARNETTIIWVPTCCEQVMRHNRFRGPGDKTYAALVCASCGKHVGFESETAEVLGQYPEGTELFSVLGVPRSVRKASAGDSSQGELSDETL